MHPSLVFPNNLSLHTTSSVPPPPHICYIPDILQFGSADTVRSVHCKGRCVCGHGCEPFQIKGVASPLSPLSPNSPNSPVARQFPNCIDSRRVTCKCCLPQRSRRDSDILHLERVFLSTTSTSTRVIKSLTKPSFVPINPSIETPPSNLNTFPTHVTNTS